MGQAVLFNLSKDLELTQVIGHTSSGKAITSNQRYANCALIFYVGYIGKNSLAVTKRVTDLLHSGNVSDVHIDSTFPYGEGGRSLYFCLVNHHPFNTNSEILSGIDGESFLSWCC